MSFSRTVSACSVGPCPCTSVRLRDVPRARVHGCPDSRASKQPAVRLRTVRARRVSSTPESTHTVPVPKPSVGICALRGACLLTCHLAVAHAPQAAEELTGHEPLSLWAAPHTAALADLLLLPPPHVTSGAGGGGGGAGGGRGGGSASPSGALDPTAVLLLGPEAACR